MEPLIPLSLFAVVALIAPLFGDERRPDEPIWRDAPASGHDLIKLLRW